MGCCKIQTTFSKFLKISSRARAGRALRRFVEVETPVGTVTALQPPGHSSAYDPRLTAVPALGEHTEAILEDLGYSEAEIAEFRTALAI